MNNAPNHNKQPAVKSHIADFKLQKRPRVSRQDAAKWFRLMRDTVDLAPAGRG